MRSPSAVDRPASPPHVQQNAPDPLGYSMLDITNFMENSKAASIDEWASASRHILDKLESYLGLPLEYPIPLEDHIKKGVFLEVTGKYPFADGLLSLKGVVYTLGIEDQGPISFGATLSLYTHHKRLITRENESYFVLEYQNNDWKFLSWDEDIYSEYEHWDDH